MTPLPTQQGLVKNLKVETNKDADHAVITFHFSHTDVKSFSVKLFVGKLGKSLYYIYTALPSHHTYTCEIFTCMTFLPHTINIFGYVAFIPTAFTRAKYLLAG